MSVMTLSRDKWKKFKEANELSKSSFFNKADVGPHIESFQKALDACKKSPGQKSLMTCFTKADDLNKAFKKFMALKETKNELKQPAKTQLEAWSKELDGVVTGLAKLQKDSEKDLKAGDATNLNKALDEFIL